MRAETALDSSSVRPPMRRAPSLTVCLLLSLMVAGCPVYDEGVPTPGEKSTCCRESTGTLFSHDAGEGELASHRLFPGCDCYAGAQCQPKYIVVESGCAPYYPPSMDAGVAFDAGAPSDAGTPADAGSTSDAGQPIDAGVPTEWAACCIDGRIAPCRCPVVGSCAPAEFIACASGTCSLTNSCPSN